MTITKERLREIRERAEKATGGPWRVGGYMAVRGFTGTIETGEGVTFQHIGTIFPADVDAGEFLNPAAPDNSDANAVFIAHARTDIPDLLDACLAQAALLGEAQEVLVDALHEIAKPKQLKHRISMLSRLNALLTKLDAAT